MYRMQAFEYFLAVRPPRRALARDSATHNSLLLPGMPCALTAAFPTIERTMSFLSLDLNLLRVFDVVMEEQNLTRAADRLAMTQPAVSNALRRLRSTLEDDLLVRTARGMKPTPRAEELWPSVREHLAGLEAAIAPENFTLSETRATFRLSMPDSTAALLLPFLMDEIKLHAPGINLRLLPLTNRDPRQMLLQSEIDLAIGSFPGVVEQLTGGQGTVSPICHRQLYASEYACVMRRGHPLARGALTLDSFCDALHAMVSFSGRAHGPVDDVLDKMERGRRIALTVNEYYTLVRVVAQSDLIAAMPYHLVESMGMRHALVACGLPLAVPAMSVDMLWHERDTRNPAHKWLRQTLQEMRNMEPDNIEKERATA